MSKYLACGCRSETGGFCGKLRTHKGVELQADDGTLIPPTKEYTVVQPQHPADGSDSLHPIAPSRGTHTTPVTDSNALLGFLLAQFGIRSAH